MNKAKPIVQKIFIQMSSMAGKPALKLVQIKK